MLNTKPIESTKTVTNIVAVTNIERLKNRKSKRLRRRNKDYIRTNNYCYRTRKSQERLINLQRLHVENRVLRIIKNEVSMNQSFESISITLNDLGYKNKNGSNWNKMDVYFIFNKMIKNKI